MKKIAVITGASEGLGFAMADFLSKENYAVILISRNKNKLESAAELIKKNGGEVHFFAADISNYNELEIVVKQIKEKFVGIDFLINNACLLSTKTLDIMTVEEIKTGTAAGFIGTIFCTKLFTPLLKKNSKILFVSSGFGLMGPAGYSVYAAVKAGVINFASSIRRELLSKKIFVYVALPGDIDTPGYRREQNEMPAWMRRSEVRGKILSAEAAAKKIFKKCVGNRFLIFTDFAVYSLYLMKKILPEKVVRICIDHIFPRP